MSKIFTSDTIYRYSTVSYSLLVILFIVLCYAHQWFYLWYSAVYSPLFLFIVQCLVAAWGGQWHRVWTDGRQQDYHILWGVLQHLFPSEKTRYCNVSLICILLVWFEYYQEWKVEQFMPLFIYFPRQFCFLCTVRVKVIPFIIDSFELKTLNSVYWFSTYSFMKFLCTLYGCMRYKQCVLLF